MCTNLVRTFLLLLAPNLSLTLDANFWAQKLNVSVDYLNNVVSKHLYENVLKDEITFLLYTPLFGRISRLVDVQTASKLINPKFDTKVIIHGWQNSPSSDWIPDIVASYQTKNKYNLIVVDWAPIADKSYVSAALSVNSVGDVIGDFLVSVAKEMPQNFLERLHVIGHSMGGQISGFVGKRVKKLERGNQIGRITGLDVAGPLFETPTPRPPEERLNETDAAFIDLIHTEKLIVGLVNKYGTVDFYVNFARVVQDGCENDLPNLVSAVRCSHQRSEYFFIETIKNPKIYEAVECRNILDFEIGKCDHNPKTFMGDEVDQHVSGTFYINIDKYLEPKDPEQ